MRFFGLRSCVECWAFALQPLTKIKAIYNHNIKIFQKITALLLERLKVACYLVLCITLCVALSFEIAD